jgi:hypothetical protein
MPRVAFEPNTLVLEWAKVVNALSLSLCSAVCLNSVALVRERTMPIEQPPLGDEFSANFCGKNVSRGHHDGSPRPYSLLSRPKPLLFLPSSSSIILTRLSGSRSRPTNSQKSGGTGNRTRTSGSVASLTTGPQNLSGYFNESRWLLWIESLDLGGSIMLKWIINKEVRIV